VALSRRLTRQLPLAMVLMVVVVGLVRIMLYHWRDGTVLLGGALLVAGGLRAVLPGDRIGMIAVRGRAVDVLTYGALGAMVIFVALTIEGGPLNQP
jgi:Protein of unknown function (DUF3017)